MEPYSQNPYGWSVGKPENPSTDDWTFPDEVSAKQHAKLRSGSSVIAVWKGEYLDCLFFAGEMYSKK